MVLIADPDPITGIRGPEAQRVFEVVQRAQSQSIGSFLAAEFLTCIVDLAQCLVSAGMR
jgi:hypothetical protein